MSGVLQPPTFLSDPIKFYEVTTGIRAVGSDGKAYLRHPVKRDEAFLYQRKVFAREKFAEGWSKRRIAAECGVSAMTIVRDLAGTEQEGEQVFCRDGKWRAR